MIDTTAVTATTPTPTPTAGRPATEESSPDPTFDALLAALCAAAIPVPPPPPTGIGQPGPPGARAGAETGESAAPTSTPDPGFPQFGPLGAPELQESGTGTAPPLVPGPTAFGQSGPPSAPAVAETPHPASPPALPTPAFGHSPGVPHERVTESPKGAPAPAPAPATNVVAATAGIARVASTPTIDATTPAPTPATAPEPAAPHVQLADMVTSTLRHHGDGTYRMAIHLQPEALGAVDVHVELRHGEVALQLHAAQADTADLLRSSVPHLRDELTRAGLPGATVDVGSGHRDQAPTHHERPATSHTEPSAASRDERDGRDELDANDPSTLNLRL